MTADAPAQIPPLGPVSVDGDDGAIRTVTLLEANGVRYASGGPWTGNVWWISRTAVHTRPAVCAPDGRLEWCGPGRRLERRDMARVPVSLAGTIVDGRGRPATVEVCDLSCGGAGVAGVPATLAVGDEVELSFTFTGDQVEESFCLPGRVSWVEGGRAGVAFTARDRRVAVDLGRLAACLRPERGD